MSGNNIYERRVKDVMSRDVVTISAGDTIHEALALMGENRVSALPVVNVFRSTFSADFQATSRHQICHVAISKQRWCFGYSK